MGGERQRQLGLCPHWPASPTTLFSATKNQRWTTRHWTSTYIGYEVRRYFTCNKDEISVSLQIKTPGFQIPTSEKVSFLQHLFLFFLSKQQSRLRRSKIIYPTLQPRIDPPLHSRRVKFSTWGPQETTRKVRWRQYEGTSVTLQPSGRRGMSLRAPHRRYTATLRCRGPAPYDLQAVGKGGKTANETGTRAEKPISCVNRLSSSQLFRPTQPIGSASAYRKARRSHHDSMLTREKTGQRHQPSLNFACVIADLGKIISIIISSCVKQPG
jgi:hypothetical protein